MTFFTRTIRVIMRLFLLILLGASLGVAAYFGGPAIYKEFIEPVQTNSQRIADLESALEGFRSDQGASVQDLGERFTEVEVQDAVQQERISEIQAEIENLKSTQELVNADIANLNSYQERLDDLEISIQAAVDEFELLEVSLVGPDSQLQVLERQLHLVRVMELLTRARLWLTQNNYGFAEAEIGVAVLSLENEAQGAPEETAAALDEIIERLEMALQALPGNPVTAADDLEIAWNLLVALTRE